MKHILLFFYLFYHYYIVESLGLNTTHRYDKSVNKKHLSEYLESLNNVYYKTNTDAQIKNLIKTFFNIYLNDSQNKNPLNSNHNLDNDTTESKSESDDKCQSENTVAECIISGSEEIPNFDIKFYVPLRDVEMFSRNVKAQTTAMKNNEEAFKVLNVNNKAEATESKNNNEVTVKCSAVLVSEIVDRCKVCVYTEELVTNRHTRFGHLLDCHLLECMNGYDKRIDNSNGVYINDLENFHPICMS